MAETLSPALIGRYLKTPGLSIRIYENPSSTNTVLRELAEGGAPEGTVVLATAQSAGRGRMGRGFFSPEGTGLYMSLLLRPRLSAADAPLITTCAAVASASALERLSGRETGIKWVNDLLMDGRKVCGILTEGFFGADGELDSAILGVGVNLFSPEGGFPADIAETAGAVFAGAKDADTGAQAAAAILDGFMELYPRVAEKPHLSEYRRRSVLTGRPVFVLRGGQPPLPALALGITDGFALEVRYPDGRREALSSGEVSVRQA